MKWKNFCRIIRDNIGPVEIIIIMVILIGVTVMISRKQKQQQRQELVAEMMRYKQDSMHMDRQMKLFEQPVKVEFKMLDSIYAPYMVDSLCRYLDSTFTKGYLTLSKQAPRYEELVVPGESYYMWVGIDRYFSGGKLVKVTGVAQDEKIIQFHFQIEDEEDTLDDMLLKLDSTLHVLQSAKP